MSDLNLNENLISLEKPSVGNFGDGEFTGGLSNADAAPGVVAGQGNSRQFWTVEPFPQSACEKKFAQPSDKRILYVNGIMTDRVNHAYTVKMIAALTGCGVFGIYNQSGDGKDTNFLPDILQCLGDKWGINRNPATATLRQAIVDACNNKRHLNIVAHSQGGIITSRALRQAKGDLIVEKSKTDPEALALTKEFEKFMENNPYTDAYDTFNQKNDLENLLRRKVLPSVENELKIFVSVQTFGSAARFYPDGPMYRHVVNRQDFVPKFFGQGSIVRSGGSNAQRVLLHRNAGGIANHSITENYLQPSANFLNRKGEQTDQDYFPIDMSMLR